MTIPTDVVVALVAAVAAMGGVIVAALAQRRRDESRRIDDLEARFRALEDYAYELRGALAQTGATVPPWPEELTKTHPS